MKKYTVKKNNVVTNVWTSDFADETHYEEGFGKPERWVLHKDEPMAEAYDDADVLEEELRELTPAIEAKEAELNEEGNEVSPAIEAQEAVMQKWVKLRAEYTIEIEDITFETDMQKCLQKRMSEYPQANDFLHAYFDGGEEALEELRQKRLAVKAKYPKPTK